MGHAFDKDQSHFVGLFLPGTGETRDIFRAVSRYTRNPWKKCGKREDYTVPRILFSLCIARLISWKYMRVS